MNKKKINGMTLRYLSAGDRLNYGDFLFSLIFSHYFSESFEIEYYGIINSDFSDFGAIPTKSYKSFVRDINGNNDVVIIGGGEVFFPNWIKLYTYINPTYAKLMQSKVLHKIESILKLVKYFIPANQSWFPFVPNFKNENIYIAAGGEISPLMKKRELKYLIDKLKEANFLSVRDARSMNSLKNHRIPSYLLPDSAILMSKVYSLKYLTETFENKISLSMDNKKYIFLQIGNEKGPADLNEFSKNINKIAANRGYTVLCCPIGQAPRHEDHLILRKLCDKNKEWNYYEPQNIFEIMLLIAKASVYIGTSLHGIITSYAYNNPVIALNTAIAKNESFIETWCNEFYVKPIDFCDIDKYADLILQKWDKNKAKVCLAKQQKMVEDYFAKISQYLSS